MAPVNAHTDKLLYDLVAFAGDERNDLAMRLVEISALRAEGELTDEEYAERRAGLYGL
jgi:transcription initiation factor IIE alpha subunit